MNTRSASITRRITLSVLMLELLAAIALVVTVTNHERVVRFEAMDANLRAMSNALFGAVQEAETENGSVRLEADSIRVPKHALYRVSADGGQTLGGQGTAPAGHLLPGVVTKVRVAGRPFRFYVLEGERIIDPNSPRAVNHHVTVVYGMPEGPTWHAVFEATRFFAVATVVLLGMTAVIMSWLVRRFLSPIRELALEADRINAEQWSFHAPDGSKRFTELAPLATAIETTVARLQRAFEQQQRFTSDAAHELKTDVAIVKSSLQLLTMKQRTAVEYEQGLMLSMTDVMRLEGTVQKMLMLARLEQSSGTADVSCNLMEALKESIAQSRPVASMKQLNVRVQTNLARVDVLLSMEEATLLCSNILMNALQHSPAAGQVDVHVIQDLRSTVMTFRDRGVGILDAEVPFLFNAFYRGDASRSRESGGTGLGLSICKAICAQVHATIGIANHPDGGAEVTIVLPIIENLRAT